MDELISDELKSKTPLLLLAVILLSASFYFYAQLNLSLEKLANISQVITLLDTLYSTNFILFILALAGAISTTVYSSLQLEKKQIAIHVLLFLITAAAFSALYSAHLFAFILMALAMCVAAFFASEKETNYENASKATSKVFTIITVLAFVGTFFAVQTNYVTYQDVFVTGVTQVAPKLAGSVIPICAQAIGNIRADQTINKDQIAQITAQSYDAYRAPIVTSAPQLANQIPTFDSLPEQSKTSLIDTNYNNALEQSQNALNSIKSQLLSQSQNTKQSSLAETKAQLANVKEYQTLMQYLPVVIGLIVVFLLGIAMFFVRVLTVAFNFTLSVIFTTPKTKTRGKQ